MSRRKDGEKHMQVRRARRGEQEESGRDVYASEEGEE